MKKLPYRIGNGFDVHQIAEERKLFLGGVEIPHAKGLLGHSDADVILHAISDAMLGALALGDIGKHFPNTDLSYKDIDSKVLLEKVNQLVLKAGYICGNIDVMLIIEKPKIAPYIQRMRNEISRILGIGIDCVSIKATTNEKMGYIGREEGAAAYAVCLLMLKDEA
ncbi:MAG: 2-C-methyl-D-erythritol 2,4-cyclodiphosphate synthase [Ignavibacteriaceae bacterium]|nr:2-C-methyl-D-erythritol 2,4-cyclodiphosphate synthase [Ignavibacteriaceae bacterium]